MELTVTIQGEKQVIQVLESMRARASDLTRAMKSIGSLVKGASMENFKGQHGPDGTPWRPLKMSTLIARAMRLSGGKGIRNKNGSVKKGAQRVIASGKALLDTGVLRSSVQVQDLTKQSVTIASRLKYSAIHQYGGQAGRGRRVAVPARPYLGINPQMRADIADIIRSHLAPGA